MLIVLAYVILNALGGVCPDVAVLVKVVVVDVLDVRGLVKERVRVVALELVQVIVLGIVKAIAVEVVAVELVMEDVVAVVAHVVEDAEDVQEFVLAPRPEGMTQVHINLGIKKFE